MVRRRWGQCVLFSSGDGEDGWKMSFPWGEWKGGRESRTLLLYEGGWFVCARVIVFTIYCVLSPLTAAADHAFEMVFSL